MRHVWVCLVLAGCMVGPDYKRPDAPTSPAFKEVAGWKISQPADAMEKGAWWSVYHDPELDRLERMVAVSNQTVKQFEADYRNAVALVAEARASLFPTVTASPGVTRSGGGRRRRTRFLRPDDDWWKQLWRQQSHDPVQHYRHGLVGAGHLGQRPPPD